MTTALVHTESERVAGDVEPDRQSDVHSYTLIHSHFLCTSEVGNRGPVHVTAEVEAVVELSRRRHGARVCSHGMIAVACHAQSDELKEHKHEVVQAFKAPPPSTRVQVEPYGSNPNDGTFLMSFYDFVEFYTHIFAAVDFPTSWHTAEVTGEWTVSCAG